MDLLAELAYVLSQQPPKDFDGILPKGSKMRWLFDLVASGEVNSEEDASQAIYGANAKDKRFLMLKRNLANKLVDLVLESAPAQSTANYEEEILYCKQKLMVSERLLQQNVYHNAERILTKNIQRAERFHLTDIALACAEQLREVAALKGYSNQIAQHQETVQQLFRKYQLESEAKGIWQIVQGKTKFFFSYQEELLESIKASMDRIAEIQQEHNNPFLKLYQFRLQAHYYRLSCEPRLWLQSLQQWQGLLRQYRFLKTDSLQLEATLALAKYNYSQGAWQKTMRCLDKCASLTEYAAFNRFEVMAWVFDVQLKLEQYNEAISLLQEVQTTPQFEQLDPIDRATWGIRTLFMRYWESEYLNDVDFEAEDSETNPLMLRNKSSIIEFLGTKQPVSGDKRGYNTQLVLLRFLFLLTFNPDADVTGEGNKMMVYYQRHIKIIEYSRTGVFFKSLAKAAINNLQLPYIEKREHKLMDQLAAAQQDFGFDACELIPYEMLWKQIKAKFAR